MAASKAGRSDEKIAATILAVKCLQSARDPPSRLLKIARGYNLGALPVNA
jgi:hypothetical protein